MPQQTSAIAAVRAVDFREGPYWGAVRHERFVGGWDVEDELAVLLVQSYVVSRQAGGAELARPAVSGPRGRAAS